MSLLWAALGDGPHPLEGNCGPTDNDWCRIQAARKTALSLVLNPDPTRGPKNLFRYEVKWGDVVQGMSDCRTLSSGPGRLWVNEGTEQWISWITRNDASWIGSYPKWDELWSWPAIRHGAGSGFEIHHEPLLGGQESGSAPLYTWVNDDKLNLSINGEHSRQSIFKWDAPLKRDWNHHWLLHILHSSDPAVGFIELWIDGAQAIRKTLLPTMFSNTRAYPLAGIYRNFNVGGHVDQNGQPLVWPIDADPAKTYPNGFVPKKGELVFPRLDGTPGYQFIGGLAIGSTRADVESLYPLGVPVPQPPVIPPFPALPSNNDLRVKQMMALRDQSKALVARLDALAASLAATISAGHLQDDAHLAEIALLRVAVQKIADDTTATLDKGP